MVAHFALEGFEVGAHEGVVIAFVIGALQAGSFGKDVVVIQRIEGNIDCGATVVVVRWIKLVAAFARFLGKQCAQGAVFGIACFQDARRGSRHGGSADDGFFRSLGHGFFVGTPSDKG